MIINESQEINNPALRRARLVSDSSSQSALTPLIRARGAMMKAKRRKTDSRSCIRPVMKILDSPRGNMYTRVRQEQSLSHYEVESSRRLFESYGGPA